MNKIYVKFQVPTAASMKITVFWDDAPCSLVEMDQRFRGAYCPYYHGDDGGSKHLWNVGQFLPDYTAHITEGSNLQTQFLTTLFSSIMELVCFEGLTFQ
jgi:hypothetical protein